mmetsp:Transcript_45003/g.117977  ORF Transcript_45003/g.117977 Transcript_45003/m.117977 type:complete len:258 (-) Transcript_45003:667-1440(-)
MASLLQEQQETSNSGRSVSRQLRPFAVLPPSSHLHHNALHMRRGGGEPAEERVSRVQGACAQMASDSSTCGASTYRATLTTFIYAWLFGIEDASPRCILARPPSHRAGRRSCVRLVATTAPAAGTPPSAPAHGSSPALCHLGVYLCTGDSAGVADRPSQPRPKPCGWQVPQGVPELIAAVSVDLPYRIISTHVTGGLVGRTLSSSTSRIKLIISTLSSSSSRRELTIISRWRPISHRPSHLCPRREFFVLGGGEQLV